MITNPIIPIWLMSIFCIIILLLKRKGIIPYIRQIIIVVLLFVINLRIMVPDGTTMVTTQKMNTKVLFVVDDTISMLAKDDGEKERLAYVREDCAHILEELNGSKFAVVSFNNDAHYISPFTDNAGYVEDVINGIYPIDDLYAKGSSMNIWKDMVTDILKEARDDSDGDIVLFFISDGEITNDEKLDTFSQLKKYVDYGAVLGYGTKQGGQMEMADYFSGEMVTIEDRRNYPYKAAVSKIDEKNLNKIADDIGIDFIHMTKPADVDSVLKNIKANAKTDDEEKETAGYADIYFLFVVPLLLMLGYEVYDIGKRVKRI